MCSPVSPTTFVQWGPPQTNLAPKSEKSTAMMRWSPSQPIFRRWHNWTDCPNWSEAKQGIGDICNLELLRDCRDRTDLWECEVCFSKSLKPDRNTSALKEHCCEAMRREEIVWISLFSVFGLILLLALGSCMETDQRQAHGAQIGTGNAAA